MANTIKPDTHSWTCTLINLCWNVEIVERAYLIIYAGIVERAYLIIYARIVERAYLIIYAGIVERAYLIIYAGISGYDGISDMTTLAASLWTLEGGGGGGGNLLTCLWIFHDFV